MSPMNTECGFIIFDSDANPMVDGHVHQIWADALLGAEELATSAKNLALREADDATNIDDLCSYFICMKLPDDDCCQLIMKVMPNRRHEVISFESTTIRCGHAGGRHALARDEETML